MKTNKAGIFLIASIVITGCFFIFSSCKKIKPDPKIPCYLRVENLTLTTNPLTEGSNSNRIPDVWVTVDGKFIGVFEMPCTFPVIADEGPHTISMNAGILINGIAASRGKYPFYAAAEQQVDMLKEKTVTLSPTINYQTNAAFVWMEDFEGNSFSLEKTSKSENIPIQKISTGSAFEGSSAFITMTGSQTTFECQTSRDLALPKHQEDMYLELNFKTNVEIHIGLYTTALTSNYQDEVMVLNPTTDWKKIYIYLSNVAAYHADGGGKKVYFGCTNSGANTPEIYLDNIKLIY